MIIKIIINLIRISNRHFKATMILVKTSIKITNNNNFSSNSMGRITNSIITTTLISRIINSILISQTKINSQ